MPCITTTAEENLGRCCTKNINTLPLHSFCAKTQIGGPDKTSSGMIKGVAKPALVAIQILRNQDSEKEFIEWMIIDSGRPGYLRRYFWELIFLGIMNEL